LQFGQFERFEYPDPTRSPIVIFEFIDLMSIASTSKLLLSPHVHMHVDVEQPGASP